MACMPATAFCSTMNPRFGERPLSPGKSPGDFQRVLLKVFVGGIILSTIGFDEKKSYKTGQFYYACTTDLVEGLIILADITSTEKREGRKQTNAIHRI
jgi:hypothetical protein